MVSSTGIALLIPASASSAAVKASVTPEAFRLMQGISTRPATGSHTSPKMHLIAIATACAAISGVPPKSSTMQAAAIAEAVPHSAWQPPDAPAIDALFATTIPIAPAVNRDSTASSRGTPRVFSKDPNAPGRIPQEPAVGVATIFPIAAFISDTAIAIWMAFDIRSPQRCLPSAIVCFNRYASPPVNPLVDLTPGLLPFSIASSMTVKFSSIRLTSASSGSSSCAA